MRSKSVTSGYGYIGLLGTLLLIGGVFALAIVNLSAVSSTRLWYILIAAFLLIGSLLLFRALTRVRKMKETHI